MPKAIFVVPYPNGAPSLPPQRAEKPGDVQLVYKDAGGIEHGGWVVMSPPKPGNPPTVIVFVQSTNETLDTIAELPNIAFIEDILEDIDAK